MNEDGNEEKGEGQAEEESYRKSDTHLTGLIMNLHSTGWAIHVGTLMHEYHVPGIAIATVQNGSVSSKGFGNASLSPLTPCTADTVFDIASSSKSFTAASVALLVDDNTNFPEVQYESTMSSLLPDDFVMSDPEYTKNVSVADLLGHRNGLPG
jgi:CubicO group peptidase (beta-lactamase class C family)